MISYPPGSAWRRGPQNNYENPTQQALADWALRNGKLQKVLQRNEYKILEDAPIFESNFLQVTKNGEYVGIYNHPSIVTVGILASRPTLLLPDLMIIARVKKGFPENKVPSAEDLEITRLIPLHLVEIFVHDVNDRRLKIQMVTGRTYYLKLCAPERVENFLFERWMHLIYLLHIDSGRISTPPSFTSKDSGLYTIWKSESLQAMSRRHWIPTLMDMDKEAKENLREKLQYAFVNRNKPRGNDNTSKKNTLNPGFTHYTGPPGISSKEGYASQEQPQSPKLAATNRSVVRDSQKHKIKSFTSPKHSRSKKQARSKTASPHSSPKARVSMGAQKSTSSPKSRVMEASCQPMTCMPPSESETVPIKLQRSKKNTSLIQNTDTALPAESSLAISTQSHGTHPGPAELQALSSQGAGESPASPLTAEKQSHPTAPSPASPNLKPHISGAARPSEAHDLLVADSPSSPRPARMGPQTSVVKHGTSVTPPKKDSWSRPSTPHKRTSKVKPGEQKASSTRRPTSQRSSPEQKRSWSFLRKRKDSEVPLRRAMVSVAAGPSQPMWKNVAVGPSKVISNVPKGQPSKSKEKSKKLIQPSSATGKPDLPRSQASESKGKVKKALSSAKQRSSLTFVTIYSILSSSIEKLRTKSKDDIKGDRQEQKLSEGEDENVTAKLSKRVTISGVVGPSGKVTTQQETTNINKTDETTDLCVQDNFTKALEQGEPSGQTQQQNRMDAAQRPKSQPSTPSGPPPKSCVSIGLGYSITETRSVGIECSMVIMGSQEAGPSRLSNKAEEDSKVNKAFQPQRFEFVEIKEQARDRKLAKYRPLSKKVSRRRRKTATSKSIPGPIPGIQRWGPRRPPDRLANGVPWPPRNWSHSSYPMVLKLRSHKLRSEMQSVSAAAPETRPKKRQESYKTAPFDPRFPNANQTRNCFQNYMDYYRCVKIMTAKGKDVKSCEWYQRVYTSICPMSWINRWDEQRKVGIFPGKI